MPNSQSSELQDQLRSTFLTEAADLVEDLEAALLDARPGEIDSELTGRIFRDLHTLKGSGAMFGFERLANFIHNLEDLYDLIRSESLPLGQDLLRMSLSAVDYIRQLLDGREDTAIENNLREQLNTLAEPIQKISTLQAAQTHKDNTRILYRLRFSPAREVFATGTKPLALLSELRDLGDCRVFARTENIPALSDMDAEQCYTEWDVLLATCEGMDAILAVFMFVQDDDNLEIIKIADDAETTVPRLGEILIARGEMSQAQLDEVVAAQHRLGIIAQQKQFVSAEAVDAALAEQSALRSMHAAREAQPKKHNTSASEQIRVPATKLDDLVDLVGELVIAKSRLSMIASQSQDPELQAVVEDIQRFTDRLQDNAIGLRLVPIGTLFGRFKRLVHDLGNELGKDVEFVTSGSDTELDKTVIQRLADPLLHLLRNALDHGIEFPGEREKAGKPRRGSIQLSASHQDGQVVICVAEDGRGLNINAIRAKALAKGLIGQHDELQHDELCALIFAPGFSTAVNISDVSGRGVGMDVVRRTVDELHGSISVDSVPEQGTTITIRLPLTMAIIDGLLVAVGDERFVLPLGAIEECLELPAEHTNSTAPQQVLNVRDTLVPFTSLREILHVEGKKPNVQQVVIGEVSGTRFGFAVDEVAGEIQAVMKSLGKVYANVQVVSGATVLGDGKLALVLEPVQLMRLAERLAA